MPKFVPRERKHRRLAKQALADEKPDGLGADGEDNEINRPAVSGKKKKRLEKYLEQKLKKDENLALLKKLEAQKVDTSLLRSSKKLGRTTETKRERLSRARQEEQAGIDVDGTRDQILLQRRNPTPRNVEHEIVSSSEDEDDAPSVQPTVQTSTDATETKPVAFGSGLKRSFDATGGATLPVIIKRKRRKQGSKSAVVVESEPESEPQSEAESEGEETSESIQDEEWAGFSEGEGSERSASEQESEDEVSDDSEDSDTSIEQATLDSKERVSAFKSWADSARNAAVGFTPSTNITNNENVPLKFTPRQPSPDALAVSLIGSGANSTARPAAAITISRSEEVQTARFELPVVQEEQKIMEAINTNPVVVVCGATGSGKTTQIPQMLFENGYGSCIGSPEFTKEKGLQSKGMIGVTQPRRVAATSVASRVATELGHEYRSRVGHQVRFDTNVSRDTAIKFMTDGILLREINQDFILSKYSAIVIDEAHERSVNTDILIGMLSRIAALRSDLAQEEPDKHYPLKLIIMSATLRVADFAQNARLFKNTFPPIVQAEGRQFPVTEHFSRKTNRDYVTEMTKKVTRGHKKLPPGTMLVFLTSQNDIQTVAKDLKNALGGNTIISLNDKRELNSRQLPLEADDYDSLQQTDRSNNDYIEEDDSDDESDPEIEGLDDADEEFKVDDEHEIHEGPRVPLKPHILPLYAALPAAQQMKVFQPAPEGTRLIVLATNVAETSLTIPGVRYVFDCGRAKEKKYDPIHGVQTFEVDWISKASASQRAGRAGRTGPGHVYRLYSSAVYEQFFAEHSIPEILRTPLEATVLSLKSMEIENVVNFPFPTPPDAAHLAQAERLLTSIGAVGKRDGRITSLGREIMVYPVNPRYGKILLLAQKNQILDLAIATVAALAIGDLFIPQIQPPRGAQADTDDAVSDDSDDEREKHHTSQLKKEAQNAAQQKQKAYSRAQATLSRWDDKSDVIKLLTAVAAYAEASQQDHTMGTANKFCQDFFLREKGMLEIQHLRHQLHNIAAAKTISPMKPFRTALSLPSEKERKMLSQVVAAGFLDQVAMKVSDQALGFSRKPRRATEVAYRTLVPTSEVDKKLDLQDQELQRSVFVHPSSVLAHLSVTEMPEYIVYSHLSRAQTARIGKAKVARTRMHPLTAIGAKQLASLAEGTPLLELGKPLGKIEEISSVQRRCSVMASITSPIAGGNSWPLCPWRVAQKRKAGVWELEKVLSR